VKINDINAIIKKSFKKQEGEKPCILPIRI
jgi:hypothetical protein